MAVRPASWLALGAGLVATATDVLYVAVILSEDEPNGMSRVALVAATVAGGAAAALTASAVAEPRARLVLSTAAAVAFTVWGALAIFSIGVLLLAAGGLAAFAAVRAAEDGGSSASGAALGAAMAVVALTALGIVVTA
jgi:hypothetical protein